MLVRHILIYILALLIGGLNGCRAKTDVRNDGEEETTATTKKKASSDDDDDDSDEDDDTDDTTADDGDDFGDDPSLFYFRAATGTTTNGDIVVTLDYPSDTTSYNTVEIRWVEEGTAPVAACNGGADGVRSVSAPFADQVTITLNTATDSLAAGTIYSLRACVKDGGGTVLQNPTDLIVPSKGTFYYIFVSSATYDGNLKAYGATGNLGADNRCQTLATAASLSGTYEALISGDLEDANAKVTIGTANLYNLAGDKIADDDTDLWDMTIDKAIAYTETGAVATNTTVWTGSANDGTLNSTPCVGAAHWVSNGGGVSARTGLATSATGTWLQNTNQTCNNSFALYCIQQ